MKKRQQRDASRGGQQILLAIDQGTTGTKAVLLDNHLRVLAEGMREFPQIFPRPGWVEHDPEEIWKSVRRSVTNTLKKARISPQRITAIGITNQRETVVIWDRKTFRPIYNAIVWQDRRTADTCLKLQKSGHEPSVRKVTGLLLDPYFSGTKISWILDQVTGARKRATSGKLCFGTIDSYLLFRLTGGDIHATDISNASRTLLLNLRKGDWDVEMMKIFRVPRQILPGVFSNDTLFGKTRGTGFLPDGIPIAGLIGDQQSALFGQACFGSGDAKLTFGTGAFLLANTGNKPVPSRSGLLTTAAWRLGNKTTYALEGSAFIAGAVVQWLRDGLGIISESHQVEALARSVPDSGEVTLVPALTGLGAPHWRPEARGVICGISRGTTAAHIARAALEGIAFQNHDLIRAMEKDMGKKIRSLRVDGGATANNLLLQFQSDLIRAQIVRPRILGTTALGAALLAGLASGVFTSLTAIKKHWKEDKRFKPVMRTQEVKKHLERWNEGVKRT